MSSFRQILYHLIIRTKDSRQTLRQDHIRELYAYIMGIIKNKNCFLYRINGVEDHVHLLSDLHPSIALADYIKDIKVASSVWLSQSGKFPHFNGWSEGYGALTYADLYHGFHPRLFKYDPFRVTSCCSRVRSILILITTGVTSG